MALSTGDQAPDFTLFDEEKQPFTLSDALGRTSVVLLFFPAAFSSTCTSELHTVSNDYGRYQRLNAEVVGISTDSPYTLAEFKMVNDFRFRLLSDHDAEVAAQYGAKYDRNFSAMNLDRIARRAAFVIGQDGTIRYAEVLENAGDQPDFESVVAALEGVQA